MGDGNSILTARMLASLKVLKTVHHYTNQGFHRTSIGSTIFQLPFLEADIYKLLRCLGSKTNNLVVVMTAILLIVGRFDMKSLINATGNLVEF